VLGLADLDDLALKFHFSAFCFVILNHEGCFFIGFTMVRHIVRNSAKLNFLDRERTSRMRIEILVFIDRASGSDALLRLQMLDGQVVTCAL